jgi:hypothetical protein
MGKKIEVMAAKDYELAVTGLTNSIWICKPSKKQKGLMTDDRVKVDESHFIGIMLEWVNGKIKKTENTLSITVDGEVVAEIKLFKDKLFKKK